MDRKRKKAQIIFFNIFLLLGSVISSLCLLEFSLPLLRVPILEAYVYQHNMPVVQYLYGSYHPVLEYTLKPKLENEKLVYKDYLNYSVSTNSDGFRGEDWDYSENRKNVIIIGDSYAMGWGVAWEDTFSERLSKYLRSIDSRFQVINLAQSGYALDQIVNCLDIFGRQFSPVCTIYLFCPNDVVGELPPQSGDGFALRNFRKSIGQDDFNIKARKNNSRIWNTERFIRGSYLNAFYSTYVVPFFDRDTNYLKGIWEKALGHAPLTSPINPTERVSVASTSSKYLLFGLNEIKRIVKGRPLILMDTSHKLDLQKKDTVSSQRWILRDFTFENESTYFVNFESLVRDSKTEDVFFRMDDHWNEKGHKIASDILGTKITEILRIK